MRQSLLSLLLVPALVPACTDGSSGTTTTTDSPITAAARGNTIVIAANEATEETGFGCGGGQAQLGRSVLFVSGDRGETFERIVPADERPLMRIASHDGVFYAVAHGNDGSFGVVTSADGSAWTEVAGAPRYAQDLAVADDLLVVAHSTGVMVSPDGITWTDREIGESFYQASVARARGQVALGTAIDGKLRLSTDGAAWSEKQLPSFTTIDQVFGNGDQLIVTGWTETGASIATVDLANPTATPTTRAMSQSLFRAVLTPAGLLDGNGRLLTIDGTTPRDHIAGFNSAAVDGNTVVVTRADSISISTDGGLTFGAAKALPIIITETPSTGPTNLEPRG